MSCCRKGLTVASMRSDLMNGLMMMLMQVMRRPPLVKRLRPIGLSDPQSVHKTL